MYNIIVMNTGEHKNMFNPLTPMISIPIKAYSDKLGYILNIFINYFIILNYIFSVTLFIFHYLSKTKIPLFCQHTYFTLQ